MDAKDEIKSRLNIEDVVGEYVQLKRSGRSFKGLSPFAAERTPSFMVSPEKQIWHDFSSGRGGDMFSFVMEMEGLDFKGALEVLARKAGVELADYRTQDAGQSKENARQKERLYEALELACKFYQVQFSKHTPALEYVLKKRRFSKATALEWRLGYSPAGGSDLNKFLQSKGFSETETTKAGLSSSRFKNSDMFRGRLMVPLCDPQGRVIGFTARLLADKPDAPKYINTPRTALYDKSRHVFGLHLAKDAIRTSKVAVLVEGNLDVISSHQAGVRNVVATAGTALTEPHLKALTRFTADIRLSFDADKAGLNATERAIPIAAKVGASLSIITIPSGKDPDELIQQDPRIWQEVINAPEYALDWLMARYQKLLDVTTAPGKRQFSDVLLPIVRQLPDSVEQDHYLQAIAEVLGVGRAALDSKYGQLTPPAAPGPTVKRSAPAARSADATQLRDEDLLMLHLLFFPETRPAAKLLFEPVLSKPEARVIFKLLQSQPDFVFSEASLEPPDGALSKVADYGTMLLVRCEETYQQTDTLELINGAARLQSALIDNYVRSETARQTTLMVQAMQANDAAQADRHNQIISKLNHLRTKAQAAIR